MYLERTLYKLLIIGLTFILLGEVMNLILVTQRLFPASSLSEFRPYFLPTLIPILAQIGRVLVAAMALYWIPKFVKQQFPEIS